MNIMLKNYDMRRVSEGKAHPKQMVSTLIFQDTFKKFNLENADNKIKQRAREII